MAKSVKKSVSSPESTHFLDPIISYHTKKPKTKQHNAALEGIMAHTYTHARTLQGSWDWEDLSVFMCNTGQKHLGSYIKFSTGHKVGVQQ